MQPRYARHFVIAAVLGLVLTGCGDDNAGSQGKPASGKASVATITFDNGEILSTNVLCHLKSQVAAGQEILYTATSLSNPYFDLTVFGENSDFTGATVTWNETEDFEVYQVNWSSGRPGQASFAPTLDGSTITGSGTFIRGSDETGQEGETRQGNVVVNCSG